MKIKLMFFLLAVSFASLTTGQNKEVATDQNAQQNETSWEVKINFSLPELDPEAIQICWLDFDPTLKFKGNFDMKYLNDRLKEAKNAKEKTMHINVEIEVTWDNLFDVVNGSEMYLLTKEEMILSQTTNASLPKIKKWLVSKAFYIEDQLYCYALPVEVENGSSLQLTLNRGNLISLTDLYNGIKK